MPDDLAAAHRQWDEGWAGVRAALIEALVRAGLVVVDQELFDHRLQVAGAEDEQWSSSPRRTRLSPWCLARRWPRLGRSRSGWFVPCPGSPRSAVTSTTTSESVLTRANGSGSASYCVLGTASTGHISRPVAAWIGFESISISSGQPSPPGHSRLSGLRYRAWILAKDSGFGHLSRRGCRAPRLWGYALTMIAPARYSSGSCGKAAPGPAKGTAASRAGPRRRGRRQCPR